MKLEIPIGWGLFFALCCSPTKAPTACQAADEVSAEYLSIIRLTVGDTYRRMAFRLPAVGPGNVHLVTDPAVCELAVRRMASKQKPGQPPYASLYVYQIGTSHAVIDRYTGGDYDGIYYFDSAWEQSGSEFAQ